MNKVLQLDRIIASEVWTRGRAGSQSSDSELQQTQFTLFCLWIASIKEGIPESEREPAREREREKERIGNYGMLFVYLSLEEPNAEMRNESQKRDKWSEANKTANAWL